MVNTYILEEIDLYTKPALRDSLSIIHQANKLLQPEIIQPHPNMIVSYVETTTRDIVAMQYFHFYDEQNVFTIHCKCVFKKFVLRQKPDLQY